MRSALRPASIGGDANSDTHSNLRRPIGIWRQTKELRVKTKIGLGVSALLVLGVVIGLFLNLRHDDSGNAHTPGDAFKEEGTFKDVEGNRIYTIALDPDASAQMVRTHAEHLEFASGKVTAAYFYPVDATIPLHSVTFASSLEQVHRIMQETRGYSPWQYAFIRTPEGQVQFVDCRQTPGDGLCRKL